MEQAITIVTIKLKENNIDSMDWFKGKSTGNHGFYHQI